VAASATELARELLFGSTFMTDKAFAFKLYMESDATPAEKEQVIPACFALVACLSISIRNL
jgi:hypothetical protein